MACCNASTLSAERRRRHFSRTSLNTRSTALSQEPLVGVGCVLQSNSRIGSIPDDGAASETCARSRLRAHPSRRTDRKSTRLNSSHLVISYAVFCLKKKTQY